MNKTTALTLAGLSLGLVLTAPVLAGPGMGGHGGGDCVREHRDPAAHAARFEARLGKLEQVLALTPAQQTAWDEFKGALQGQAAQMQAMHETRAQARTQDGAGDPDRMAAHIARMETRLKGMKAVQAARQNLLQTLSPEQQETFGEFFAERGKTRS